MGESGFDRTLQREAVPKYAIKQTDMHLHKFSRHLTMITHRACRFQMIPLYAM
jgi:hypothetical protein